MVQPLRLAALAAATALVLLLFSACGEEAPTPSDPFLADIAAKRASGLSFEAIAEQITDYKLAGQKDPLEGFEEQFDPERFKRREQEQEPKIEAFVRDIQNRNCDAVRPVLEQEHPGIDLGPLLNLGIFHEEGICLDQSKAKAAEIYREMLADGWPDAVSSARLGALYWTGEGVDRDTGLAREYFLEAALEMAPHIWIYEGQSTDYKSDTTLAHRLWGRSQMEMDKGFTDIYSGPWDIPEPLSQTLSELLSLKSGDTSKLMEIAQNLKDGVNGYPKDLHSALAWMGAATGEGNLEAEYLRALWGPDPLICEETADPVAVDTCELFTANRRDDMALLADRGHKAALRNMIDYYETKATGQWVTWGLYQYCLIGQAQDVPCSNDAMKRASDALSKLDRQVIKAWIDDLNVGSIVEYLPGEEG